MNGLHSRLPRLLTAAAALWLAAVSHHRPMNFRYRIASKAKVYGELGIKDGCLRLFGNSSLLIWHYGYTRRKYAFY